MCVCVCVCVYIYVYTHTHTHIYANANIEIEASAFPDSSEIKNPPCNAGDLGLILSQGTKIPYAAGQLSPGAVSTEPAPHK